MSRKEKQTFETENEVFATRLRYLMDERGTTQSELAEVLGVRRQTVSLYMNGQSNPDWKVIASIARYFEVTADYLVGLEETRNHKYAGIGNELNLSEDAIEVLYETFGFSDGLESRLSFTGDLSNTNAEIVALFNDIYDSVNIPSRIDTKTVADHLIEGDFIYSYVYYITQAMNAELLDVLYESLDSNDESGVLTTIHKKKAKERLRDFIDMNLWRTDQRQKELYNELLEWCLRDVKIDYVPIGSEQVQEWLIEEAQITTRVELVQKYRAIFNEIDGSINDKRQFHEDNFNNMNAVGVGKLSEAEYAQWLNATLKAVKKGDTNAEEKDNT